MQNYYFDLFRSNRAALRELKTGLERSILGRDCIVLGSAPDPIFPAKDHVCVFCVNGSMFSLDAYRSSPPDFTYLNGAIFKNNDLYKDKTIEVLKKRELGNLILSSYRADQAQNTLKEINACYTSVSTLNRYDKRVILSAVMGYNRLGFYLHDANISNGLLMAALSIWGGAARTILVGFSFNSKHVYSVNTNLSSRGHVNQDSTFLGLLANGDFNIETTSLEISGNFGIKLHSAVS